MNSFRGKGLRDPGHGRFPVRDRAGKDKRTLKIVLVEKPEKANAKDGQCELRNESERVQKPESVNREVESRVL